VATTEPRIRILPQEVAERIAAGEVVERPASVVKELVENALDAGARKITIEAESGGKALIRVTDDGCGMTAEEAGLSLFRHATSKIRSADDLFDIHTLGFRGEALPSIAAVSELEILTRTADAAEATRLVVRGGVIQDQTAASAPVGTSISVRHLFYNLPVREKFLRGDATEAGQITEWIQRLAMARSDVSFRLLHDRREAFLSPGSQDPLNAAVSVLGRQVARDLLRLPTPPLDASEGEIVVTGFVGRPTLTRANRSLQHFYVNGRSVRSALFNRALTDAYRATMPAGRHPVAVLFLQVPPGAVDVNVHPAKTEVRFPDEAAIVAAMLHAVRAALRTDSSQQAPLPVAVEEPAPTTSLRIADGAATLAPPETPASDLPFAAKAIGGPTAQQRYSQRWSATPSDKPFSTGELDPFADPSGSAARTQRPTQREAASRAPISRWQPTEPPGVAAGEPEEGRIPHPVAAPPLPAALNPDLCATAERGIPELTLLGQAQNLFILAEGGGRLWVIDQHVAHERVLFDRLTSPGPNSEPSEQLLIPVSLSVDRSQALALEDHRGLLAELGFEVEPFGVTEYVLRSVPRSLLGRNYEVVFKDLAHELAERSDGGEIRLRKEEVAAAAAGRSCKSAVKAGQNLGLQEVEQLLADLRQARNPHTCPHGRPVFLTLDQAEVAALFGGASCG